MKATHAMVILMTILFLNEAQAQKETWNWYFGNQCALNWSTGVPVAMTNSAMNQYEGSASISDANGNLLFYTDGISAWNTNHITMPNGTGMMGNFSTNQSALIVPKPGSTTEYYLFSNSSFELYYSIVDMSLQGGLGDVTTKNVFMKTNVAEKLAGVRHSNGAAYWVMVHEPGNNSFFAYEVTAAGVSTTPVISSVGINDPGSIGQMQFSPDGKRVAFGTYSSTTNLGIFDFDAATGIVSNPINVPVPNQVYGLSFSPNSKVLYRSSNPFAGQLFQYDLDAGNAAAVIASELMIANGFSNDEGHLQIGPDKKVYLARDGLATLGVIEYPDSVGMGCAWNPNGVTLAGKLCGLGLPNFVASYFNKSALIEHFCFGDTTTFLIADSASYLVAEWTFDDPTTGPANISYNFSTSHVFSAPGTYNVQVITVNINSFVDTALYTVVIEASPVLNLGNDTTLCTGQSITLNAGAGYASYLWQNGSSTSTYTATVSGTYGVQVSSAAGCKGMDSIDVTFSPCAGPVAALASSDTLWCDKTCIDFFDLSQNNPTSWTWYFQGASPSTSTDQNPTGICYNNYGSFDVTLVACNAVSCDSLFLDDFVTEFQLPAPAVITFINDTLFASPAVAYQWYNINNINVVLSTNNYFVPVVDGGYFVLGFDSIGCSVPSATFGFYTSLYDNNPSHANVYYNSYNDNIEIKYNELNGENVNYVLLNAIGQPVETIVQLSSTGTNTINTNNLTEGIYFLQITDGIKTTTFKLSIVK
nr:T9SS type A sorting domain-containing protein [Bacteroidota bacterium]